MKLLGKHSVLAARASSPPPFAMGGPYRFYLERTTPPTLEAIDRAKAMLEAGWDLEAVVTADGETMVILGCLYLEGWPAA